MSATILIIEDNANIRGFIRTTLEIEGFRALETGSVREGLEAARREQPDLILLDLSLPDGTGWDFLEALREQPAARDARIVVLTASADHGMADRVMAAGATAFLTKPIAAGELVAHVRRALDTRHASERSD
jgi:two-component system KDP operon response regulator KdpE